MSVSEGIENAKLKCGTGAHLSVVGQNSRAPLQIKPSESVFINKMIRTRPVQQGAMKTLQGTVL